MKKKEELKDIGKDNPLYHFQEKNSSKGVPQVSIVGAKSRRKQQIAS